MMMGFGIMSRRLPASGASFGPCRSRMGQHRDHAVVEQAFADREQRPPCSSAIGTLPGERRLAVPSRP